LRSSHFNFPSSLYQLFQFFGHRFLARFNGDVI
jgi:hypothetical protein